jgi:hypothetical protein
MMVRPSKGQFGINAGFAPAQKVTDLKLFLEAVYAVQRTPQ